MAAPDQLLKAGDLVAKEIFAKYKNIRMPNLGLGDADVKELVKYLLAKSSSGHAALRLPVATESGPPR